MRASTRRWTLVAVLLIASTLLLWQCTGAFDRGTDSEAIDVFGPWLDDDAEAFAAVLNDFSDRTGIEVRYTGSNDFDSDLRQRVTRGMALPDIAVIPQPGLIAELYVRGLLAPLAETTIDEIVANFPLTREQLAPDGVAFLAPYRANVKSLVWYRPDVFADNGWVVPDTLDGLHDLVDEIAGTEIAPWCFTIESGSSTGWAATDWIEDLLLRRAGVDAYDAWAMSGMPFTDPAVRDAVAEFDELVLAPGRTTGGAQRILGETVAEASQPMFGDEPGCAMYRQANFATGWFPDDVEVGPDETVDFFVLPGADGDAPLLRGGDGLIQFDDRDEVNRLMTFLASDDGADEWLERGGYLSSRITTGLDQYPEDDRPFAALLQGEPTQRFDASDSFPSEIRDAWLASLTDFIAESGRLDDLAGLDALLSGVEDVRARLVDELGDATEVVGAADGIEASSPDSTTNPTEATPSTTEEEP